ncbi:L-aspartate dehydrogenase OS=Ureibacillus acetophenoni OX=614649 GN=nadX PE=3 SV=1 [Ureibacillus acetophenoni]
MKIGIIGTGNIAQFLLEEISKVENRDVAIVSVFGRNQEVGKELAANFGVTFFDDFGAFLDSPIDLVVEAATVEVVKQMASEVINAGKHLVVSSVGAFADSEFYRELQLLVDQKGKDIFIPSGAIGGIDIIKSANALGGLHEVSITTRKSPASLGMNVDEETIVFEGSATEAIQLFPKNINVAIVLSLAGIGEEKTRVAIIADPKATKNTHTIKAVGDFGQFELVVENEPMKRNPKTSALAALSILSILKNMGSRVKVGS